MGKAKLVVTERHRRRLAKKRTDDFLLRAEPYTIRDRAPFGTSEVSATTANLEIQEAESELDSEVENIQSFDLNPANHPTSDDCINENEQLYPDPHDENCVPSDNDDLVDHNQEIPFMSEADDEKYEEDDEELANNEGFLSELRNWALTFKIAHNAINALLKIISKYVILLQFLVPKDARKLLQTPRNTTGVQSLSGGLYYHFGLRNAPELLAQLYKSIGLETKTINLLFNIDGLPISRSSPQSFWPILVSDDRLDRVFLVGIYYGNKKPNDANEYLQNFVDELRILVSECFSSDHFPFKIEIKIKAIVCDAPAKSFILYTKGHSGYSSCTKCTIHGEYIAGRVCFPYECNPSKLRTNEEFIEKTDLDYNMSNKETSLTTVPNLGLVTNVAIDYMHLICLGTVKKLLLLWLTGPLSVRIGTRAKDAISEALIRLRGTVPAEFSRKPRSLSGVAYWKATEFRQLLLYTGPIVLKGILKDHIYLNFLTLHAAVSILISPNLVSDKKNVDYAEKLLQHFVKSFEQIYGKEYVSHNIHNLLHLADEVRRFGPLDSFSAFRFGNFLQMLKNLLRKAEKPLQQVIKRYAEMVSNNYTPKSKSLSQNRFQLKARYTNGLLSNDIKHPIAAHYKRMIHPKFEINCNNKADNCLVTSTGEIIIARNIVKCDNNTVHIVGHKMNKTANLLYSQPCSLAKLDIFAIEQSTLVTEAWPLEEIAGKLWKIENRSRSWVVPIRHIGA